MDLPLFLELDSLVERRIVMTIHPSLQNKLPAITRSLSNFYYNWASSSAGFLKLVIAIRFAVLLISTMNFGYLFLRQEIPILQSLTGTVLWIYFLFILILLSVSILKADLFESLEMVRSQIIFDGFVVAYFYWSFTHMNRQSNVYIFMFYFLPLLLTARFLGFRTLLFLMIGIAATSILTWGMEIPASQLRSFEYWFTQLLPQFGLLLIMTAFYMIYYRRRRMGERLQTLSLILEDQLGHLWQGWLRLDKELNVTAWDAAMAERHIVKPGGLTCAQVLCSENLPKGDSCPTCPINKALGNSISMTTAEIKLTDRTGAKYSAQINACPLFNDQQEIIGVSAWVQDLDQRRSLMQKQRTLAEDLERVIDQNRRADRARAESLARKLDAVSQASELALSTDVFRGTDEIVRAMVLLLGCRVATVRVHQIDEETGREGLVLCNHYGLDPKDVQKISFLDLDSSSLAVEAFKKGEDQYIEDFQKPGLIKFEELLRRYDLRSMACFPLKIHGEVIGTFTLFRNRRQGFSEGDLQLSRALSNILSTLVANQRQLAWEQQESHRRKREMDILSSLSQKLVTIENPDALAQLVADIVQTELHAETAAVFLKKENRLHRTALSGIEEGWFKEETYAIGEGFTGRAALQTPNQPYGKRMVENNAATSELLVPENMVRYSQKLLTGMVQHLVAVPLNGLEGTFGVLRIVNKLDSRGNLDRRGFTEQETKFMTTLACVVAVAMENSRLFEAEKKKHGLAQAVRQSTRNLTSTLEEGEILETILEQLRKVVPYDTASLFLQEKDGLRLKSMAGFIASDEELLRNICLDPNTNVPFQKMKESGLPILVSDLWKDQLLDPIVGTARIRSWIGVPLIIKDQIIGWLSVDSWMHNHFTQDDVEVAQDFAQQAAIAINNARQYKLQKEELAFLKNLEQRLVEITSAANKNASLNTVALTASQLMNCEMAGVALYDKESKEIRAVPGVGYVGVTEDYARNFHFSVERNGGRVLSEKKVYTSRNASADPQSIFGQRLISPIGVQAVIASPLQVGEHVVGVLYAARHSPHDWDDSQIALFSILSNHAAIAIRNSELLDVKERRAQLLDLLHHLSIAGQLTNDPEVIYNILLTAVTAEYGLRFNRAVLLLYDKELNALKGFTGIGQLEYSDAHHVWEMLDDNSHSFQQYINDVLLHGVLHYTALHYKAKNLEIPIRVDTDEVFSRVFLSRKLEVVNPANEQGRLVEDFYRLFDANPFVVLPLLVNSEVVGMLVVDNKMTSDPIRRMELELLESCASQAAAAIYRSNLHQQLEERVHVMEHLQVVTRAFSELAEPREVLRRIAQATTEVLHADVAYLAPYDSQKDELLVTEAVTAGAQTEFLHEGTFSTHGLTSLAKLEPSGLVTIEDLKSQKDLRSRFAEQEDVCSVAVCRLELRKNIIGMLYVNYRRRHWFSDMELGTLRMLAGHAAVAIHNARLLRQNEVLATQRERNRLREDLHDVLNTYAFKVMEPAESIFEKEKRKHRRNPELLDEAEELWRFSRHTYQQLERILEDMRDPVLVTRGLAVALGLLIQASGLPGVNLSIRGEVRPSADVELVLYRICQEAISNIHKHANLPKSGDGLVKITLELEPRQSRLVVQDRGVGFSPGIMKDRKRGMGLQSIHNWARKISARLVINSKPGEGTLIDVMVPRIEKENTQ